MTDIDIERKTAEQVFFHMSLFFTENQRLPTDLHELNVWTWEQAEKHGKINLGEIPYDSFANVDHNSDLEV